MADRRPFDRRLLMATSKEGEMRAPAARSGASPQSLPDAPRRPAGIDKTGGRG
jgi:hypothetical protein